MYSYKGYEIGKTFKHGYVYWKVSGDKTLFSTLRDAKRYIDRVLYSIED